MSNTALLIIDVQKGMFESPVMPPVYAGEQLLETLGGLIEQARAAQVPVIYIQHNGRPEGHPLAPGTAGWPIHPAIQPREGELVIQKLNPDAFQDTSLQAELEAAAIKKLVIAGIQTEFCVDTTCRRAYSLGYELTLVKDGHSTWDNDNLTAAQIIAHHNQTLGNWFATAKSASEVDLA
jgi:nicotinamidase-related amidase